MWSLMVFPQSFREISLHADNTAVLCVQHVHCEQISRWFLFSAYLMHFPPLIYFYFSVGFVFMAFYATLV